MLGHLLKQKDFNSVIRKPVLQLRTTIKTINKWLSFAGWMNMSLFAYAAVINHMFRCFMWSCRHPLILQWCAKTVWSSFCGSSSPEALRKIWSPDFGFLRLLRSNAKNLQAATNDPESVDGKSRKASWSPPSALQPGYTRNRNQSLSSPCWHRPWH